MSVTDTTTPWQSEAIAFEFDLPHAPEKVWRALTTPELLAQWLLPSRGFGLAAGTVFTFSAPPQPGWDGQVHCELLAADPHERLRYRWRVADMNTVVTFTLAPTPGGTRLLLVQSGFTPAQKRNFGGARYGWRMMGQRLVELLERTS